MISQFSAALHVTHRHIDQYVGDVMRQYTHRPEIPERSIPEGDGVITIGEDGKEMIVEMRTMQASATKPLESFVSADPEKIYGMLHELAFQMAVQQLELLQEKVGEAAQSVGNNMERQGTITAETIFNIHRKIRLDFYPNGEPHVLEMISGPEMTAQYDQMMAQIKADPELNREFEAIIEIKRQEWHARENNRKLVG